MTLIEANQKQNLVLEAINSISKDYSFIDVFQKETLSQI